MALTLLRSPGNTIPHVIFGKLPTRADFIRINAAHPVAIEFDDLIQHVLAQFSDQADWKESYDTAPSIDFCYPSRDEKWLFTGTMVNSHDQTQRRFPMVAGAVFPISEIGNEQRLLPLVFDRFFAGLREYLANALEDPYEVLKCRRFLESHTALWIAGRKDIRLAAEVVQIFMDTHHPSILEPPLAEKFPPGSIPQALLNILFYRDFLRRFNTPPDYQVLELPLLGSHHDAALHASAWLSLLSALSETREPGGFLLRKSHDCARLYATFDGNFGKTLLVAMGGEDQGGDTRLDLRTEQNDWQAHELYAETAYAMDRTLKDPALNLSSLIGFIRAMGRRINIEGC